MLQSPGFYSTHAVISRVQLWAKCTILAFRGTIQASGCVLLLYFHSII